MSLMALSEKNALEQDEDFRTQAEAALARADVTDAPGSPPEQQDVADRDEGLIRPVRGGVEPTMADEEPPALEGGEGPVSTRGPKTVGDETEQFIKSMTRLQPADDDMDISAGPMSRPGEVTPDLASPEVVAPAERVTVRPSLKSAQVTAPDGEGAEADATPGPETLAVPAGVPKTASGVNLTEQDRVAALAEKVRGSVGDAGSIQDFLGGLPARPSVATQKEIRDFERRIIDGLELKKPVNWPEFMMFPTYEELRRLHHKDVTPEFIRNWEEEKQVQADALEARAGELNDWIFSFGDGTLNEKQRLARMKNREEAIKKRSADKNGKEDKNNRPDSQEITDEELYKDRHYGIRFATLLNPSPDHLNQLRKAPIAAWGHDMARTLDGGRVRVSGDEIRAVTVSAQAAQLIVMEAKARGWETLRISGDNEFCAAVKQACKEQGMGAIITRRGPLGLGPFSKPEHIMPRIPDSLGPQMPDAEQRSKQQAAPAADQEAADKLLGDGATADKGKSPPAPSDGNGDQPPEKGEDASDDLVETDAADPSPDDPAASPDQDDGPAPDGPGDEVEKGPRPDLDSRKIRLDEVDVKEVFTPEDRPEVSPDEELTPIQRL
jgi:hypothetical protein